MKKVFSLILAVAMISALFCVNVSASVASTVVYENGFEEATGAVFVPETEGSENNVMYLVNIADDPETADIDETFKTSNNSGWIDEVADFDNGFAVEAKVKCLDTDGLSLFFEAYNGDSITSNSRGFVIPSSKLKADTWYNVRLVFRNYYYVKAVVNEVGTDEYLTLGTECSKGTLSGNSYTYTPEGSDTSVTIKNYYNRARFVCHEAYGPNITKDTSITEFGWMVDDVKFEKFAPVASNGVVWEQNYEDALNTNHAGVAYAFGRDGGTAASYYAEDDASVGNSSYTLKAEEYLGDNAVLSFDIKKMAPSAVFNVHAGTGTKLIKLGIPGNQLREDVWYTYVAVMENGATTYWRKAEDSDVWQEVGYSYKGEGIETLAPGQTTDVEKPITLSGVSSNGNSNTTILRMAIMYGATSYSKNTALGSDFGNETIKGSHYLIDNYKLTELGALEGIFGEETVEMSTFAKPGSTTYVASFDESGRMIDASFTTEISAFAEMALDASRADTVRAFVWGAENAPVSSWDVTEYYAEVAE